MTQNKAVLTSEITRVHYVGIQGRYDGDIYCKKMTQTAHFRDCVNSGIPFFSETFGDRLTIHNTGMCGDQYDFTHTRKSLDDTIKEVAKNSDEKSFVFVTIDTHGSNGGSDWYFYLDPNTPVGMNNLVQNEDFQKILDNCAHVFFVINSCYSGAAQKAIPDYIPAITSADHRRTSSMGFNLQELVSNVWLKYRKKGFIDMKKNIDMHFCIDHNKIAEKDYGANKLIIFDEELGSREEKEFYNLMCRIMNSPVQKSYDPDVFFYSEVFWDIVSHGEWLVNNMLDFDGNNPGAVESGRMQDYQLLVNKLETYVTNGASSIALDLFADPANALFYEDPEFDLSPMVGNYVVSLAKFCAKNSAFRMSGIDEWYINETNFAYFNRICDHINQKIINCKNNDEKREANKQLAIALDNLSYLVMGINTAWWKSSFGTRDREDLVNKVFDVCLNQSSTDGLGTALFLRDFGYAKREGDLDIDNFRPFERYVEKLIKGK